MSDLLISSDHLRAQAQLNVHGTGQFRYSGYSLATALPGVMDGPPAGHVGGLGRTVWGWAIDMAAASGTGVNQEVFAQPVTGGAETLLGTAAFEAVGRGRFAKR